MKRVASFEKVSFEQFFEGFTGSFGDTPRELVFSVYESIRLPRRATSGSAGYDFFLPTGLSLKPGETVKIPTGIRAKMEEDYVLLLFPRSSLGFRYRLQLDNTIGVVDSDYYGSSNEGHIFAKLTNDSNEKKTLTLAAGDGFMQGLFLPYGITDDDHADAVRDGGFGSTSGVS